MTDKNQVIGAPIRPVSDVRSASANDETKLLGQAAPILEERVVCVTSNERLSVNVISPFWRLGVEARAQSGLNSISTSMRSGRSSVNKFLLLATLC